MCVSYIHLSNMPSNHYETLGIEKDASEGDIKKAYRALSLKYHPDRNSAPEATQKFQEINAAYETLSDSQKRSEYDDEMKGVNRNPFMNMSRHADGSVEVELDNIGQFFNMMFGGAMPGMPGGPGIHVFHGPGMPGMHGMPGMPGMHFFQQQLQKPPSIIKNIQIPFEQAFSGCSVALDIEKWSVMDGMKVHETQTIHLNIPQGIADGETIVLRDCGNSVREELKGDVKVVVGVVNHTVFQRHGMDLIFKKTISLKESLTGFTFDLKHVSGKILCLNNLTNRTIIKPNYKKLIPGLGMQKDGASGNLIIEFDVEFPDSLTEEQMNGIAAIL